MISLANFNIRATPRMRIKFVYHDLRMAKDLKASIYNWQEIAKYWLYRRALKKVFPGPRWRHLFLNKRTPITIDTYDFDIGKTYTRKLSKADPRLPNPPRYANAVELTEIETGEEYVDIDAHFTNGGFNNSHPRTKKIRAKRWHNEFSEHKDFVHGFVEQGKTVVGSGDYNRKNPPKFHPNQINIVADGVMLMWVVPGKGKVVGISDVKRIAEKFLNTDHAGLYAAVRAHKGGHRS